jgi:peptidyl-prolyl cis-trans isomerase C
MKRLLREPLVHFLLLGAILFGVYAYAERGHGGVEQSKQIRLTINDLSQLVLVFQSQWRRDPTPEELQRLVEDKLHEEILYREALALGLDKDDTIVRRRMAQKMQFLAEDVAAAREPTPEELGTWYEANRDQFALPPRVSFRHLYFSPDRRGARARDDAAAALTKLAGQPEDSNLAATLADAFMSRGTTATAHRSSWGRSSVPISRLPSRSCRRGRGKDQSSPGSAGISCSSTR